MIRHDGETNAYLNNGTEIFYIYIDRVYLLYHPPYSKFKIEN